MLHLITSNNPLISVIIDVGAQILGRDNQSFAQYWLSKTQPEITDAAVFYDNYDEAMVVNRRGYIERLPASPFCRRMGRCVVFLDQHHARGVDLKLPLDYRAAVILGPRLTKDRLAQGKTLIRTHHILCSLTSCEACNRMRELGNG